MHDSRSTLPRLTLARTVFGFVFVTLVTVVLAFGALLWTRAETLIDDALDKAVRTRTEAASQTFARTLASDWNDLKYLALATGSSDSERIQGLMDGMRGDGTRISWIGYAAVDGTVLQASNGLLEGADVSERPWFRNGLQRGYAGDKHEAVLLAKLLPNESGEPLRFIDLALPVQGADGTTTGVVGMHIDAAWAEEILRDQATALSLDLFLISADGSVAISTDGQTPSTAELNILRAAVSGSIASGREVWPDGRTAFSSLVTRVTHGDMPSFGWRMVGRLDASTFRPTVSSALVAGLKVLAALLVVLGVITMLYVRFFIRPIARLVVFARLMADGTELYPPEGGRTREAAELSVALARLQARSEV